MDILVSYSVFIYRFYWVTWTAPVIIGNWRPSKCVFIDWLIDWLVQIIITGHHVCTIISTVVVYCLVYCMVIILKFMRWKRMDIMYTGGFRRRAVANLAEPSSLVAAEHERLVAMVTGNDQLVEVLVAHVNVVRHPRRVRTTDHCTTISHYIITVT